MGATSPFTFDINAIVQMIVPLFILMFLFMALSGVFKSIE
jgi:hypothetical protein